MTRAACTVTGCDDRSRARGLCARHYMRWFRARLWPQCSVPGCRRGVTARSRCNTHYVQLWRAEKKARTGDDSRSGQSLDAEGEARQA
jgi:hypothetical protein